MQCGQCACVVRFTRPQVRQAEMTEAKRRCLPVERMPLRDGVVLRFGTAMHSSSSQGRSQPACASHSSGAAGAGGSAAAQPDGPPGSDATSAAAARSDAAALAAPRGCTAALNSLGSATG